MRRRFYELAAAGPAPIASGALKRIGELYAIKPTSAVARPRSRAARQDRSRPAIDALEPWLRAKLETVSQKDELAVTIRYAPNRWEGLARYLDDGCIELASNPPEECRLRFQGAQPSGG